MAYSVLYNENIDLDLYALLFHLNEFTKGLGLGPVSINPEICRSVLLGIRQDFPHKDGIEKASVFKRLANFITFFVATRPIQNPFETEVIGADLAKIPNHQNAIAAFQVAIDSLHGATIGANPTAMVLQKRIELSKHSYIDIIDALSEATPATHFKMVTVLLEQLSYKSNPNCQYKVTGP